MKREGLMGIVALALAGCVVNVGDSAPDRAEAVPPPPVPMVCNAAPAQYRIGHDATQSPRRVAAGLRPRAGGAPRGTGYAPWCRSHPVRPAP